MVDTGFEGNLNEADILNNGNNNNDDNKERIDGKYSGQDRKGTRFVVLLLLL